MSAAAARLRLGPEKVGPEPGEARRGLCDATAVFEDRFARPLADRVDPATSELRLRLMGHTKDYRLLVVAFVARVDDLGAEVIRLISAREALPHERKAYEQNPWGPQ